MELLPSEAHDSHADTVTNTRRVPIFRGHVEVMHGDHCVLVIAHPPGEPIILEPDAADQLAKILRTQADHSRQAGS